MIQFGKWIIVTHTELTQHEQHVVNRALATDASQRATDEVSKALTNFGVMAKLLQHDEKLLTIIMSAWHNVDHYHVMNATSNALEAPKRVIMAISAELRDRYNQLYKVPRHAQNFKNGTQEFKDALSATAIYRHDGPGYAGATYRDEESETVNRRNRVSRQPKLKVVQEESSGTKENG